MSVAFRRDGDEEHLEPKFEIPIPPGPNLVTARGLALIEAQVAALTAVLAKLADREEEDAAVTRASKASMSLGQHSYRLEKPAEV